MSQFKQALRALLDERHMSQAELARRLNLSPQAVSAWLTSSVTPSYEHVSRIDGSMPAKSR